MSAKTDRAILAALERIESHLARILVVEPEIPTVPTPPSKPRIPMRDRVSVIPHRSLRPEIEDSMGALTRGGTDPDRFWARPDPYAAELAQPARRMGRRIAVTR
jgi:hypothetical protein